MSISNTLLSRLIGNLKGLMDKPSQRIPLSKIGQNNIEIKTINGEDLIISHREAEELKRRLPEYLHERTYLPIQLLIESTSPWKIKVAGGLWDKRIVYYLLHGKLSWKPPEEITVHEAKKMISNFPSLIHLMLKVGEQ